MYNILYTRDFKKSLRKLQKSGKLSDQVKQRLSTVIDTLIAGGKLPESYRDHKLKGDLVLVYKRE